jgi:hypothetical protein
VNYLYGWYTNEENTTWYRKQQEEAAAEEVTEVPFTTEAPVIENKPIKRRRKPTK